MNSVEHKQNLLNKLYEPYKKCIQCPLGFLGRKNVVFGEGNPDAELMIIGEAPGKNEDEKNIPFIGRSGKLLTNILENFNIKRSDIFITNIVKCRPPNNRKPKPVEATTCMSILLRHQINIIQPTIICTLGSTAAENILNTKISLNKICGKIFFYNTIPVIPTYHPAYIVRNPSKISLLTHDIQKTLLYLNKK